MSGKQNPFVLIDDSHTGDPSVNKGDPTNINFFDYSQGNWAAQTGTTSEANDFGAFGDSTHGAVANNSNGVNLFFNGVQARIIVNVLNCADLKSCAVSFSMDGGAMGLRGLTGSQTTDFAVDITGSVPGGNHFEQLFFQQVGATVDYALVTPVFNSPFPNMKTTTLFVNHSDPTILFDGKWDEDSDGRSIHSSTPGDHIYFSFAGTDLTILAIFPSFDGKGNVTMGLTLDSRPEITAQVHKTHTNDNYNKFFTLTDLTDNAVHNVTLRVIDVSGPLAFNFRGFVYTPNFQSVADMPVLPPPSSLKVQTPSNSTNGTSSQQTDVPPPSHASVSGGTIAGAVVGSLVGIALIGVLVFLFIRKRKRSSAFIEDDEHPPMSAGMRRPPPTLPHDPLYDYGVTPFIPGEPMSASTTASPVTSPGASSKRAMMMADSKSSRGDLSPTPNTPSGTLVPRPGSSLGGSHMSDTDTASQTGSGSGRGRSRRSESESGRSGGGHEMTPQMMEVIERIVNERVERYNQPPEYDG